MPKFENEQLGVKFSVPEEITLRDELAYYSATNPGEPWMIGMWLSALVLITGWECKDIPDPKKLDLDKRQGRKVFQIITWAGAEVATHVGSKDVPDPN